MHRTIGGREAHGWYRTEGGMVFVETAHGSKATQIGGSDPSLLAYILLRIGRRRESLNDERRSHSGLILPTALKHPRPVAQRDLTAAR